MVWVILSILSGFFDAFSFAYMKKLGKLNSVLLLSLRHIITLPLMLVVFLFYEIPKVKNDFYLILFINVILMLIGVYLAIKSFEISDLSVAVPMLSFTPVFLLAISYIMLGEKPSNLGLLGIFAVVIGSYIVNSSGARNYLEPFKAIFKNMGVLYMLAASFIFSFNATLTKIGVVKSNSGYFVFANYFLASVILAILFYKKINMNEIRSNAKNLLWLGIATALMEVLFAVAIKYAIVSYAISLKRTSVVFSVIIGYFAFKEKNIKNSFFGSIIMFIGVLLITLT